MPVNETLRADRIEREERARNDEYAARESARILSATALIIIGAILILAGAWFLIRPSVVANVVNIHRLYLGQTAALAGVVLLCAGFVIRTREPIRPPVT